MFTGNDGRLAAQPKMPFTTKALRSIAECLLLVSLAAFASANDVVLTLGEAERLAVEEEPGQVALTARADALAERAVAAGELPVPQWRAGVANFPLSGGGFDREPMTMAQLGVQQMFPPGNSRRTQQHLLQAQSLVVASRAAGRTESVREAARIAWLDLFYWGQAATVAEETRPWLQNLVAVAQGHYEAGHKGQKDLVRAELEVAMLEQQLIAFRREEAQARVRLSQWIGNAADRPIAATLPESGPLPELEALLENLRNHPELRASRARTAASEQAIGLARENFKAGWSMGLSYGYRAGTGPDGRDRSDLISLQVTRDLPFLGRNKQNSELAAALKERRASEAEFEQDLRRLSTVLRDAHTRHVDLDTQIAQQRDRVLKLAQFEADAALAAYQNDQGDFSDLASARVKVMQHRLELIRLQVGRAKAGATIANLGGSRP
jgi:outer membrane protein TolC